MLTPREREVLQLIAEGHTTDEIAEMLTISPDTAHHHRTNLKRKLRARSDAEMLKIAIKKNLRSSPNIHFLTRKWPLSAIPTYIRSFIIRLENSMCRIIWPVNVLDLGEAIFSQEWCPWFLSSLRGQGQSVPVRKKRHL